MILIYVNLDECNQKLILKAYSSLSLACLEMLVAISSRVSASGNLKRK